MTKTRVSLAIALTLLLAFLPQITSDTTYLTSAVANILFKNNFHEVVPGRLYRSAEMSRADLDQIIKEHGIKSVIDLRLKKDQKDHSGESEQEVVENNGGRYFHVPLKSDRAAQQQGLEALLRAYDQAELPILVHCSSGTHRSGVASAIWMLDKEHATLKEAQQQLTAKYGFFKFERALKSLYTGQPTLDTIFGLYQSETEGSNESFRDWLAAESKLSESTPPQ